MALLNGIKEKLRPSAGNVDCFVGDLRGSLFSTDVPRVVQGIEDLTSLIF